METIRCVLLDKSLITVIVGIGNVLRNDDGVGPYIAKRIHRKINHIPIIPEAGIERYISAINRENPDLIVFVDCVDFGKRPGFWDVIAPDHIVDTTCHSHNISLNMLTRFFTSDIRVIGIQPSSIEVGEHISEPVMASALEVIEFINEC